MSSIHSVLKVKHSDKTILSHQLKVFPNEYASPKSPKLNELRARFEAHQKAESLSKRLQAEMD